ETYTLSLHDALPISLAGWPPRPVAATRPRASYAPQIHWLSQSLVDPFFVSASSVIWFARALRGKSSRDQRAHTGGAALSSSHCRSEEHTSELQSLTN